tara:strand:- start:2226 stop:2681 length:456 start_codon:yes stop_codon:yes gene_type:complete
MPLPIDNKKDVAVGIALPLANSNNGYFTSTFTTLEQAKHNLKNLFLTRKGERVMQPEFGTDLYNLIFEQVDDELPIAIKYSLEEAIQVWLPYLKLIKMDVELKDDEWARDRDGVQINISTVFSLQNDPDVTESLTFSIAGGLGSNIGNVSY